ncbi:MAG: VWA domain-containing protein, partial [Deltaproteobacteria bacterium]|nr:VWA domain-containing protein [Deltaproteobacteria bacterium]
MTHVSRSMVCGVIALAFGLTIAYPGSVRAQTQVRPRILMIFDTSGSMEQALDGPNTHGDGSWDPWPGNRFCCPGSGESRLYIAKEAMRQMVFATGDIDFALMKFPQSYVTHQADTTDCSDGSGTWIMDERYDWNQVGSATDYIRYAGREYFISFDGSFNVTSCSSGDDSYGRYCDHFSYNGGWWTSPSSGDNTEDWISVPFPSAIRPEDNRPEILSWMDHHEYSSTTLGTSDSSSFEGPYGDLKEQELRADGDTPIGGSLYGARQYLLDLIANDSDRDCRPYSIILLTDGNPVNDSCATASTVAAQLLANTGYPNTPIYTWVIALAVSSSTLNGIAAAGGTGSAKPANSQDQLSQVLYDIISQSLLIEQCNYLDDDCDGETDEDFRTDRTYCDPTGWVEANCPGGSCPCPSGSDCDGVVVDPDDPHPTTTEDIVCMKPPEQDCDGEDENCDGETDEGSESFTDYDQVCGGGPNTDPNWGQCQTGNKRCSPGCPSPDPTDGCWMCVGSIGPSTEVCDTVDNDCDGWTDERNAQGDPLTGGTCTNYGGYGECGVGTLTCNPSTGTWFCYQTAPPEPTETTCDGLDNDCDGFIDEGLQRSCFTPPSYSNGVGICQYGQQVCDATPGSGTEHWGDCLGETRPRTETCNLLDDDCDGDTDENGAPGSSPLLVDPSACGTCEDGQTFCIAGAPTCCAGLDTNDDCIDPKVPSDEICDGLDNNCDGQTDENTARGCYTGGAECTDLGGGVYSCEGICHAGTEDCTATLGSGTPAWGSCENEQTPLVEECNLLDDDCDGDTDESGGVGSPPLLVDPAICGPCGDGQKYCINGVQTCCAGLDVGYNCIDPTEVSPESCNGLDDNCNGETDENMYDSCGGCVEADYNPPFECDNNFRDRGTCVLGQSICDAVLGSGTEHWGDCDFDQGPVVESCNELDDDCDGETDEGVVGDPCGACHDGTEYCIGGKMQCCMDGTYTDADGGMCDDPTVPVPEECDGVDNDCDDVTDEYLVQECGDQPEFWDIGICHNGNQNCDYQPDAGFVGWHDCDNEQGPLVEECDCLDNDCDGMTDEQDDAGTPLMGGVCGYGDCGIEVCDPLQCDYVCSGHGRPEDCNGLDDNCNAVTDEGMFERCGGCDPVLYPAASNPVEDCWAAIDAGLIDGPDEGECQRGVSWCESEPDGDDAGLAEWGDCQGSIGPKVELCDDKDNDCDGTTDEEDDIENVGDQCQTAEGICEDGWRKCVDDGMGGKGLDCCADVTGTNECIPPQGPEMEECNALDDDCD